jgi:hypothetical protein
VSAFSPQPSGSDSRDCVDIIIDAVGDTTVRPIPPHLLPYALAEREKLAKYQHLLNQTADTDPICELIDPNEGPK